MRPKLTLKDVKFVPKEVPPAPPPPPRITCPQCGRTSYHPEDVSNRYCGYCHQFHNSMIAEITEEKAKPGMPQAIWVALSGNWLRVVIDNRPNIGRRIYRIELYDKDRSKRIAIFRRQTEAVRQ